MLISIGIPAYNSERHLRSTLQSVIDQSFGDWELIIVNDGSKDKTAEILTEFEALDPRIIAVAQANAGIAAARNRAYAEMSPSSKYVMFLDHDDILKPGSLEKLYSALSADDGAVAAYGQPEFIDGDGTVLARHPIPGYVPENRLRVSGNSIVTMDQSAPTDFAVFAAGDSIITPGMALIRKSAYDAAGGWDPDVNLKGCDDLDLWFRLTLLGHICFLPDKVLQYRLHATNTSSNVKMMRRSERCVRRKVLAICEKMPERRRELQIGYRKKELKIASDKFNFALAQCKSAKVSSAAREAAYGVAHLIRGFRGLSV